MDFITVIATSITAAAAVFALVITLKVSRDEHERQYLRDRLSATIDLMASFEELQAIQVERWLSPSRTESAREHQDWTRARAIFAARLRASSEPLPICRGAAFRHLPFGSDDPVEAEYLREAPAIGNPETDSAIDMKMRAEIVGAIDSLRSRLDKEFRDPSVWRGRPLSDGF